MKQLSNDELEINEQAVGVAASVVGEAVEAATRCEQVTEDMTLEAAGVGGVNRGFVKGAKAMSRVMMPRTMGGMKQMETGGLPKSFVLAVTASTVYAIEDKYEGGNLVAGKVLKSWDRDGFVAKLNPAAGLNVSSGVPDDRQILIIYLPIEGGKSRYMQAAARPTAAYGSPGMPHRVALAKDEASQKVIDAVTANAPAPGANIVIGGQSVADMMAQAGVAQAAAQQAADPAEQLGKLADLHDRGALTDEEFAAQKAKILGTA
jgi:hypothetical protein